MKMELKSARFGLRACALGAALSLIAGSAMAQTEKSTEKDPPRAKDLPQADAAPKAAVVVNAPNARLAGLIQANDATVQRGSAAPAPAAAPVAEAPAAPAAPQPAPGALVIDKPLRSGQQVYARGRDLVVMAMVNPGAEVIADGHIHVYAPLRGKAIAGARGNGDARIFAMGMDPELISIAGIYRTSETPLPASVQGKAAQVRLVPGPDGDKLVIEPLNP